MSFGGHGQGKIQGPDTGARGGEEVDEDQLVEELTILELLPGNGDHPLVAFPLDT